MGERLQQLALAHQALAAALVAAQLGNRELGDAPAVARLAPDLVNVEQATAADVAEDGVALREPLAGRERRGERHRGRAHPAPPATSSSGWCRR